MSVEQRMTALRVALAVDCPDCDADPGEPCWSEDGTEYVVPHAKRFDRMSELVARAEELYEAQGDDES